MRVRHWLHRLRRLLVRSIVWLGLLTVMIIGLRYSTPPLGNTITAIGFLAGDALFDYVGWSAEAAAAKAVETLYGIHPFMSEAERSEQVRVYMADLTRAQQIDARIDSVYADPNVSDPDEASASLRAERDALRASLAARQTLVEAVLEGQVAAVLVEEGFGVAGQLMPPIAMRFTRMPNMLVISPRESIRFEYGFAVDPLTVEEQSALEARVETDQDISALIVPLGGMALFPAMILERASIPASLETFAHEWLHHYLLFFPLGLLYDTSSETRIINETTAVLFGREVGRLVLQRYYPELIPASTSAQFVSLQGRLNLPAQPPEVFDYGRAMHETRTTSDALLAEGKVDEAERYLEERRRLFVDNGYLIRRLNQAFFAFYGGYQTGAPGVGGQDPIGPAVQALRDQSASLHEWIVTMRSITTRDALLSQAG